MPAVPLLNPHGVGVELLVEVVEQRDGLDDHDIDLVGGESELVAGQRVGQTEGERAEVLCFEAGNEVGQVGANVAIELDCLGLDNGCDVELRQLVDGCAESCVGDSKRHFFFVFEGLEQLGQHGGNLALSEAGHLLETLRCAIPFDDLLEL